MSKPSASLLDLKSLSSSQIHRLFSLAQEIKTKNRAYQPTGLTIGLLFFEASTRTRISFETAAHRIGLSPLLLDGGGSSLEKGESVEDSILNVAAMNPHILVIRCGDSVNLEEMSRNIPCGILNAGWGVKGHPTQALLDVFTMQQTMGLESGVMEGKKILFVGDIRHSRVAASHFEISKTLKTQVAVCAPAEFQPESNPTKTFLDLNEGLSWADVVIVLRCQFERHQSGFKIFSTEEYRRNYGLSAARLKNLKAQGLIMHPGPINHGIEMESEVLADPRCRVLQQVSNGVFVREAILRSTLMSTVEGSLL